MISFASRLRSEQFLKLTASMLSKDATESRSKLFSLAFGEMATESSIRLAAEIASDFRIGSPDFVGAVLQHINQPHRSLAQSTVACISALMELECGDLTRGVGASEKIQEYTKCMLQARYVEAYEVWNKLPEVNTAFSSGEIFQMASDPVDLGVVLPGTPFGEPGRQIDLHTQVARTVLVEPIEVDYTKVGSRTDLVFLNSPRHKDLARVKDPDFLPPLIVSINQNKHRKMRFQSEEAKKRVKYELRKGGSPVASREYLIAKIVDWAVATGHVAHLYNADFYLGDAVYQSRRFETAVSLEDCHGVILSYLAHDVFSIHRYLRSLYEAGLIIPYGALESLLNADGNAFAEIMETRWSGPVQKCQNKC